MSSPKPKTSLHERCLLLLEIIPILKVFSVLILTSFQELSTQETIILVFSTFCLAKSKLFQLYFGVHFNVLRFYKAKNIVLIQTFTLVLGD